MTARIDCDTHLFEPADLWGRYVDPADRELALRIAEDDLGYPWLMYGERKLGIAEPHRPGEVGRVGEFRARARAGLPNDRRDEDREARAEFADLSARIAHLDDEGFDAAVLFPNYGLLWERSLASDLPATLANLTAWNRWAAEVRAEGGGRLHPVGHLTLRDLDWLEQQLATLSAAGVRLGFIAPGLVDGRALSDPTLDRAWAAFVHHGITPVFHVADQVRPFHDAWYGEEDEHEVSALQSIFLWTAPALALTDLVLGGVLERYPDLRIGVMELSAPWVPLHLQYLDGGFRFAASFNGHPAAELSLPPSEYIRRQVRIAAFSYEMPKALMKQAGDMFMACSDYPHTEGTATAVEDYRRTGLEPGDAAGFFGGNVGYLLRADQQSAVAVGTS
jgi:predicted TIM-barrel fold metal-dependent hydrolase